MRIDPRQAVLEIHDALDQLRPDGPFRGTALGVEVVVTADGSIADLHFAEAVYRATHVDDLSHAIVAAYRQARMAAFAAHRRVIDDAQRDRRAESRWDIT